MNFRSDDSPPRMLGLRPGSPSRQLLLEQFLRSCTHRFVGVHERGGHWIERYAWSLCPELERMEANFRIGIVARRE